VLLCLAMLIPLAAWVGPNLVARQALAANYAKWQANGSDSYTMTVEIYAFMPCSGVPVTVTVEDGQVVGAESTCQWDYGSLTVEHVFEEAGECLDNFPSSDCQISYDPALGYPTHASLDPILQALDDEVTYEIIDLQLTP